MAIGKKLRFEVFKRDGFTCRYCGRRPPEVILNADHVTPVSKGGEDVLDNLATSCWDCNNGKSNHEVPGDTMPPVPPPIKSEELQRLQEAHDRITQRRGKNWQWTEDFIDTWKQLSGENPYEIDIDVRLRDSLKCFLKKMSPSEITEALQIAFEADASKDHNRFKYFCGICWRMIKKDLPQYPVYVRKTVQQNP